MGLFNNFFGNKNKVDESKEESLPWIPLISENQLEEIVKNSSERVQIIFKHSTTCGISRMVLNRFGKDFDFKESAVDLYYLDIHANRHISDEVATLFEVRHESPQLLILKRGKVVAHESHGEITNVDLSRYT